MDSSPKISFNQQVVSQGRDHAEPGTSGFNISPYKRILSLVKEGNPNGLRNFLGNLQNAAQYVNQTDKDLLQTPLYQAVQVKNKTLAFSLTSILFQHGVSPNSRPRFCCGIFMASRPSSIFAATATSSSSSCSTARAPT